MYKVSVCIPTYEMGGLGVLYLKENFDFLKKQTFKNFEVVISDHSSNSEIENLCIEYSQFLHISYYRNTDKVGISSANLNNSILKSKGEIIKILFQDDFLFDNNSLEDIVNHFDLKLDKWLVTACEHTYDGKTFVRPFYPKYHNEIHKGINTISSPSVLTILNSNPILFDENLIWLMDCDYYKMCNTRYGEPKILNKINVVNRVGIHQVSNTIVTNEIKNKELKYVLEKIYD
jgi:glycosyltransferase involved in cell wall biosynthesis